MLSSGLLGCLQLSKGACSISEHGVLNVGSTSLQCYDAVLCKTNLAEGESQLAGLAEILALTR